VISTAHAMSPPPNALPPLCLKLPPHPPALYDPPPVACLNQSFCGMRFAFPLKKEKTNPLGFLLALLRPPSSVLIDYPAPRNRYYFFFFNSCPLDSFSPCLKPSVPTRSLNSFFFGCCPPPHPTNRKGFFNFRSSASVKNFLSSSLVDGNRSYLSNSCFSPGLRRSFFYLVNFFLFTFVRPASRLPPGRKIHAAVFFFFWWATLFSYCAPTNSFLPPTPTPPCL